MRAELVEDGAWHVTVDELPHIWTVAFDRDSMAERVMARLLVEHSLGPEDVELVLELPPHHLERRRFILARQPTNAHEMAPGGAPPGVSLWRDSADRLDRCGNA